VGAQERWIWGSGGYGEAVDMGGAEEMEEWRRSESGGSGRISSNGHKRKAHTWALELGIFFYFFYFFFLYYYFFLSSMARRVGVLETMLLAILSGYFLCL